MADAFGTYRASLDSPAENAAAVTPGATPLANVSRALWVGGAGDVTVTMVGGQTVTFANADVGFLPVRVTHVTAATATDILAVW